MKKRLIAASLIGLASISLLGCAEDKYALSEEDNNKVAQYVAGQLMKYEKGNAWNYEKLNASNYNNYAQASTSQLSNSDNSVFPTNSSDSSINQNANSIADKPAGSQSSVNDNGQNSTANSSANETVAEDLGLHGTSIVYDSYEIGDRYPTDAYAVSVAATSGNKVLAVKLKVKNDGGTISANTSGSGVVFRVVIADKTYTQSASILKNDLTALKNIPIQAQTTYDSVVVFQIPESAASNLDKLKVIAITSSGTYTIKE